MEVEKGSTGIDMLNINILDTLGSYLICGFLDCERLKEIPDTTGRSLQYLPHLRTSIAVDVIL